MKGGSDEMGRAGEEYAAPEEVLRRRQAEIDDVRAELHAALFGRDRLRDALRPFAGVTIDKRAPEGDDAIGWILDETWNVTVKDWRRAAEVYGAASKDAGTGAGPASDVVPFGTMEVAG